MVFVLSIPLIMTIVSFHLCPSPPDHGITRPAADNAAVAVTAATAKATALAPRHAVRDHPRGERSSKSLPVGKSFMDSQGNQGNMRVDSVEGEEKKEEDFTRAPVAHNTRHARAHGDRMRKGRATAEAEERK